MKRVVGTAGFVMLVVSLSMLSAQAADGCKAPVSTTGGRVVGTVVEGLGVCAYKGIPYAAPPVNERRWRPPEPAPRWDGVLNATDFGPECAQIDMGVPGLFRGGYKPTRSEDCLYLNIWRPKKTGTYPVMVWIHGGGLMSGSASEPMYRGDRLAGKRDVVVVTFNYRLGAFGFLAHRELSKEDLFSSSGNYGLLDQIAALEWVKKNIASFGGDPNNVTIFGESAGGWSVCNLLASPLAEGLFQRAIIESGGCDTTTTMEQGFADGDEFAEKLGCPRNEALACMLTKSTDEIVAAMGEKWDLKDVEKLRFRPHFWLPHEDGWVLKETPIKALRNGRYNKVPLMVGSNRDEAKLFLAGNKLTYRWMKESKVKNTVLKSLGKALAPVFEKLYPYKKYRRAVDALADAIGDMMLGCKCFEAAEASANHQPTYYYRFDYDDSRAPHVLGAAHAMEIPFIFDGLDRPYFKWQYSRRQEKRARPLVEAMMSYWTNFAKRGDPNGAGLMKWPTYDIKKRMRMILDVPQRVEPAENVERCAFWHERYEEDTGR